MVDKQDVDVELFVSGAWQEQVAAEGDAPAGADVFSADGITVYKGSDSETDIRPHKIELTFNDSVGRYRTSNPLSPLYGLAGRNTGLRVAVNGILRTTVEASSWRPERTPDFVAGAVGPGLPGRGRAAVKVTAEGVSRRLGQWTEPLRSPLFRRITRYASLVGYWPMEDGKDSDAALTNALPGGGLGVATGATFADDDGPGGSDPLLKIGADTRAGGNFAAGSASAGWQISWSFRLPAIPGTSTFSPFLWWSTTNGYTHWFDINDTQYRFNVRDGAGTLISSNVVAHSGQPAAGWLTMRVKNSISAGTVSLEPAFYTEGATGETGFTATFPGTVGALNRWGVTGSTSNTGAWLGHLFGVTGIGDNLLSTTAKQSFNGYKGERCAPRWSRLLGEEGITRYVIGDFTGDTPLMGVQRSDTLMELLKECARTDDGRFDDERYTLGALTFRTRRSMYNQAVALALTYPTHITPPFAEEVDDLTSGNRVTLKNFNGSEYTAGKATGPMSVLAPPDGIGEYKRTIDVSLALASDLEIYTGWHLSKGTLDRPRYEQVTVDLLANPTLEPTARSVREGDLITITGYEPETIPLIVIGIVERIGHTTRTMTFTCRPGEPYQIGKYDSTSTKYDSATTTLSAGVTSSATSLTLTFTNRADAWSTTAGPSWYGLKIAGERVQVTAMGAVTGSGPWQQVATVTRAVNGVAKALPAGAEVHVADPARYGL